MARPQLPESGRMTVEELAGLPVVMDIGTAARAWGLGRTAAYERARADDFPCEVVHVGRFLRVRKADLMRSLGLDIDGKPLPVPAAGSPEAA